MNMDHEHEKALNLLRGLDCEAGAAKSLSSMNRDDIIKVMEYVDIKMIYDVASYTPEFLAKIIMLELKKQSHIIAYELDKISSRNESLDSILEKSAGVSQFIRDTIKFNFDLYK